MADHLVEWEEAEQAAASRDHQELVPEQRLYLGALLSAPPGGEGYQTHDYRDHPQLQPEDFTHACDGAMFRAIKAVQDREEEPTTVAVIEQLRRDDALAVCSENHVQRTHNPDSRYPLANMVERIRAATETRRLGHRLQDWVGVIRSGKHPPLPIMAETIIAEIEGIRGGFEDQARTLEPQQMHALMADVLNNPVQDEVASGFGNWDELAPLVRGGMTVVAARPGVGKTTIALNVVARMLGRGCRVMFATYEMTPRQIYLILAAILSGVPVRQIKVGEINAEDSTRLSGAINSCPGSLLLTNGPTVTTLTSEVRRMTRTGGCDLVVVDYLQKMPALPGRWESDQVKIAALSGELKSVALNHEVPLIALSQLNRGVENRADNKPKLSELRQSGAIEQDADHVILLSRDDRDLEVKALFCEVAKNRHGPVGDFLMKHTPSTAEMAPYYKPTESMDYNK